jgi:hypothetical protein
MVSFTPRPLYPQGNNVQLGGLQRKEKRKQEINEEKSEKEKEIQKG